MLDFEQLRLHVLAQLETNLPAELFYHGVHHTRDDVLPAAENLAKLANLSEHESLLLKIAALYHDIGYTKQYPENEPIGAEIAAQDLQQFGYGADDIELIKNIILATSLSASPQNYLEELIRDADLDSLGRDDFFLTSHSLRLELHRRGAVVSVRDWYARQLKFLESHRYHTELARQLRDSGKSANIRELRSVLGMAD